jgi:hypothetical protein
MKLKSKGTGSRQPGKDQTVHWLGLTREYVHDTYKTKGKLPEPTVCSRCGAVFQKGKWKWGLKPSGAHESVCPACRRIEDRVPSGILLLSGPFLESHREEVENVIHNQEKAAKKEHPLCRVMSIEKTKDGVTVTTTDTHLPRRIGEALWHAYHGELNLNYGSDSRLVRVTWKS